MCGWRCVWKREKERQMLVCLSGWNSLICFWPALKTDTILQTCHARCTPVAFCHTPVKKECSSFKKKRKKKLLLYLVKII